MDEVVSMPAASSSWRAQPTARWISTSSWLKRSRRKTRYIMSVRPARIASILRLALEEGIDWSGGDVALLTTEPESASSGRC